VGIGCVGIGCGRHRQAAVFQYSGRGGRRLVQAERAPNRLDRHAARPHGRDTGVDGSGGTARRRIPKVVAVSRIWKAFIPAHEMHYAHYFSRNQEKNALLA